jgi:hypothetical protein
MGRPKKSTKAQREYMRKWYRSHQLDVKVKNALKK